MINDEIIGCTKCDRLIKYREFVEKHKKYNEEYWSRPITGYGDINGRLLIIGLAPAAHGGNRTGRIFTGDKSSDFLVSSLYSAGITNQPESRSRDDGLIYIDSYITLALKCAPPENKPLKCELKNCSVFLFNEIRSMVNLRAVLVLGRIAFDSYINYLKTENVDTKNIKFKNFAYYDINNIRLYCSYHPSPRNVNTGLLKKDDFVNFLISIRSYINGNI
ncbi:uracil-DNA glycosylase [Picrophilus oshimae]|uniref:Type-5 uracil-DNA glycosylase n=1 Tax=Picrophilus torridus (strain ATCC 700027 / DSM 9790 / JCM 10055 / NBRC 100828 / KAW 2/3) TaxID=1122961 RepID=A0A8G2L7K7_PICTO|nr:uracil-DNA glycosylase [Picrophilus oshimae]SMD31198.1 uracil-DNA glycosylase, family 4 [Picrophilus oshimae DSM 9789]